MTDWPTDWLVEWVYKIHFVINIVPSFQFFLLSLVRKKKSFSFSWISSSIYWCLSASSFFAVSSHAPEHDSRPSNAGLCEMLLWSNPPRSEFSSCNSKVRDYADLIQVLPTKDRHTVFLEAHDKPVSFTSTINELFEEGSISGIKYRWIRETRGRNNIRRIIRTEIHIIRRYHSNVATTTWLTIDCHWVCFIRLLVFRQYFQITFGSMDSF